jgi:hypothetical protein
MTRVTMFATATLMMMNTPYVVTTAKGSMILNLCSLQIMDTLSRASYVGPS